MKVTAILTGCCVHKNIDVPLFAVEPADRVGDTTFHVLLGGRWTTYDIEPEWTAVGMAAAHYPGAADWTILAASAEGDLWELTPGSTAERQLKIPGEISGLTRLACIGSAIHACGMDRMVLRREENGDWTDISAKPGETDEGVVGFTHVAGLDASALIAVGWNGEIWSRIRGKWSEQDSGSNANFNAVSISDRGEAVVVGDNGTLVVGTNSQWTVLDSGTEFNLEGVCHFGREVFICSDFEIFRLMDERLIAETRFVSPDLPTTCMNLIVGNDCVFCQGENDIFRFSDGVWTRVF